MNEYKITTPKFAGGYRLGTGDSYFEIKFLHKPMWLHRTFMRLLLGWQWVPESRQSSTSDEKT